MIITSRRLGFVAADAIVLAACGSRDAASTVTDPPPPPATVAPVVTESAADEPPLDGAAMDDTRMGLSEFAEGFSLTLTSDVTDSVITDNEVTVNVAATGHELSCHWAGKAGSKDFGHYHLLPDNALVDMRSGRSETDRATTNIGRCVTHDSGNSSVKTSPNAVSAKQLVGRRSVIGRPLERELR